MNHIKTLQQYARLLVVEKSGYDELSDCYILALDKLDMDERMELCRLFIESKDRDMEFMLDGIRDGDHSMDSEFNCKLLAMLSDYNDLNRDNLIDTMIANLFNYASEDLQDILDNACDDYQQELKENKGFDE
jgi:hypothetical protein